MNRAKIFTIFITSLIINACSSSDHATTGSLTMRVQWPESTQTSASLKSGATSHISQAPKGAVTMRVIVSGDGMNTMQADFIASANQGTLNNVPAGTNRTVTLQGISSLSTVLYQGQVSGVQVLANTVNDAGVIVMAVAAANADGDGVPDEADDFPNDAAETTDTDLDGIGNNADTDDDGDGIFDVDEIALGTSSLLADTDGDGLNDGQERGLGLNPLVVDNSSILRINLTSTGSQTGGGYSLYPGISADGRYMVFYSSATNLVANDTNAAMDVFRKDFQTGDITRISVDSSSGQAVGGSVSSNGSTDTSRISADGRYIVFDSEATNLVASDTNAVSDIFLKDTQSGITSRISVDSGGVQANNMSYAPAISADGRYVVFVSAATNLVANDTNGVHDVFLRDILTGVTSRISTDSSGVESTGGESYSTTISADGHYAVIISTATNLVANDTNGQSDVFIKEVQSGIMRRVSTNSSDVEAVGSSFFAAISADGRYVAFVSTASNLVANDTNSIRDIFLKDTHSDVTSRINTDSSGAQATGGEIFSAPAISADGRYVVFKSAATNLVANDTNGLTDIFLRDIHTGVTTRLNVHNSGAQALGGQSSTPVISADGHYVLFSSSATNLVANDSNSLDDIFRVENPLYAPDTDGDGIRDDIENNILSTNPGSQDTDGDSVSDYDEVSLDSVPWNYAFGIDTNPNLADSDGDNFGDGQELGLGMNPLSVDSGIPVMLRLNISSKGAQSTGGASSNSAVSADGRHVVFDSNASNLVNGDSNGQTDVFLKDTLTGVTTRMSVDSSGVQASGGASSIPALSNNGRYVVFESAATNLVANDTNGYLDVFLKDSQTGVTSRISVDGTGLQAIGGASSNSTISADGRYVAFLTFATNLFVGNTSSPDVIIKDTVAGAIVDFHASSDWIFNPVISGNGSYVVYESDPIVGKSIYLRDLVGGSSALVSTDINNYEARGTNSAISNDGRYVVFDSSDIDVVVNDTNNVSDVFIKDIQSAVTTRLSTDSSGNQSNGSSINPVISADGRYVVFESDANNLVLNDTNGNSDIFLKNTLTGVTTRISFNSGSMQATGGNSTNPAISADGCYVTFRSDATNLVANDTNSAGDIFRVDICP